MVLAPQRSRPDSSGVSQCLDVPPQRRANASQAAATRGRHVRTGSAMAAPTLQRLLALQRGAGNGAVVRLLQQGTNSPPARRQQTVQRVTSCKCGHHDGERTESEPAESADQPAKAASSLSRGRGRPRRSGRRRPARRRRGVWRLPGLPREEGRGGRRRRLGCGFVDRRRCGRRRVVGVRLCFWCSNVDVRGGVGCGLVRVRRGVRCRVVGL